MAIQIDSIQKQRIDPYPSESDERSAEGLHHVFSRDQVCRKVEIGQLPAKEAEPSFWTKIKSWFTPPIDSSEMAKTAASVSELHEPINLIPELDIPVSYPKDLQEASLLPIKNRPSPFTQREVMEIIDSLQDKTVNEIMMIVAHMQLDLEKENALVVDNCITKLQNMKKMKEDALLLIKEALLKDEKVLARCKTAQNVAFVAAAISGLFATVVSAGLFAPIAIVTSIATLAPIAAAALTGIGIAAKGYSERRLDEDKASYMQFNHEEKSIGEWMDSARNRLQNISESDEAFKDRILKLITEESKIRRILMQRT